MKRMFVLALVSLLALPVLAGPSYVKILDGFPPSLGFEVVKVNGQGGPVGNYAVGQSFRTFCVELDEWLAGSTFLTGISTTAYGGGVNTNSGDPLDPKTAYLYTQYMKGSYGNSAVTEGALQRAIYLIEEEIDTINSDIYGFDNSASTKALAKTFYDEAVAAGWTGTGNVKILNLWAVDANTGKVIGPAQDQLILVPAPAALALASLGMGLVGYLRRRSSI